MSLRIAFVIPPTSDLNTPYAAAPRLAGWLRSLGHEVVPLDFSLDLFLEIFSKAGLTRMFDAIDPDSICAEYEEIYLNRHRYIQIIDDLIAFAQGRDVSCVLRIVNNRYLPVGPAFRTEMALGSREAFGRFGNVDLARHMVAMCLQDLSHLFQTTIAPHFALNSYAEKLGRSRGSFDEFHDYLTGEPTVIQQMIHELADEQLPKDLDLVCMTAPFPGNVMGALVLGKWLASNRPDAARALGGGYCSTELRSLTDPRPFDYLDYIVLDDGELPVRQICRRLEGDDVELHSTYTRDAGKVVFHEPTQKPIRFDELPSPDYRGLPMDRYVNLIYRQSHVSRLLSEGTWLKLTAAHGCYWKKCAFCDIHLSYIGDYDPMSAGRLADQMDELHEQTGISGFHFTDEAAPPALLFGLALELLRRGRTYHWWGNIRYDKAFSPDRCRLLAAAGMVAVTGGIETASDEVLQKIQKGVSVEQLVKVLQAFSAARITTHAYLIYGFPGETNQHVIDGLETLRQMIKLKILKCGYYHQLSVTAHAPLAKNPELFQVRLTTEDFAGFARNDLPFVYEDGVERTNAIMTSCKAAMSAYEREAGLDRPVQAWFAGQDIPPPTIAPDFVSDQMKLPHPGAQKHSRLCWLGGKPEWYRGLLSVRSDRGYVYTTVVDESVAEKLWSCHPEGWASNDAPRIASHADGWYEQFRDHGMVVV